MADAALEDVDLKWGILNYIFLMLPCYFGRIGGESPVYQLGIGATMGEQEGLTAIGLVTLPSELPKSDWLLFESHIKDWRVVAHYLATGRIRVMCKPTIGQTISVHSCPIFNTDPRPRPLFVLLSEPDRLDIEFSGHLVGSTDLTQQFPDSITIQAGSAKESSGGIDSLAKCNSDACIARQQQLGLAKTRPGRKPGGKDFDFNRLRTEVKVLKESIVAVEAGGIHHHVGVARCINLLLIPVRWGHQLGLLQRCAAHLGAPLIAYTVARPRDPIPILPDRHLRIAISCAADGPLQTPIDIDVWLPLVAGHLQRKEFSNYDVLKAIGDTFARHADPDWEEIVEMLQTSHTSVVDGPRHDFLAHYVLRVGQAVLGLSEQLLSKA